MNKIARAIDSEICNNINLKNNLTFQLFGIDVIFNKSLHPFLLEFNKGPSMKYLTQNDMIMKNQLLSDVFTNVGLIESTVSDNNQNNNFIKINT